jgi:ubiquinone/menaquinone biosynthesis C-methylase UbiE
MPDEEHFSNVAAAFDSVAENFEVSFENEITWALRRKTYAIIESLIPSGGSILDINCGIGIDAVELALRGFRVTGVDVSSKMIEQARLRATTQRASVDFCQNSFEDLRSLAGNTFDLVLSNFGGLNCVERLDIVARQIAIATKKHGYFVGVVMPPFSLWEFASYLLRGDLQNSIRRVRGKAIATGFQSKTFTVCYHSSRNLVRAMGVCFHPVRIIGLNILSPTPQSMGFFNDYPRLTRFLQKVDSHIEEIPGLRQIGDHFVIILRKQSS